MEKEQQQDLMLYWKPDTAENILRGGGFLSSATSDQLYRASPGDTIWIVTVDDGELFLLNKLYVDETTNRMGAVKKLGITGIWGDTEYYAIAPVGKEEPLKKISLSSIADKLTFQTRSTSSRKLNLSKGRVNPQQLQTMRILDASSAGLLQKIWVTP